MERNTEQALYETLEKIYTEHRQGLFTLAMSVTRNAEQAEDAIHEAIARLCRSDWSPVGDPVAYVFRSVRNASLDQLRKRRTKLRSTEPIFEQTLKSPQDGPDHDLEADERSRVIQKALENLSDDLRQIVSLKIYGNLTFRQIAQTLDQPLSTVASRYQRALKALREPMETLV